MNTNEISKAIKQLHNNQSGAMITKILNFLIMIIYYLSPHLCIQFDVCFSKGYSSLAWTEGVFALLHKGGTCSLGI
jgi:hypothetical protein